MFRNTIRLSANCRYLASSHYDEAVQSELARRIGTSRRVVGKYVEELEQKGVCTIRRGRNQYARTCFEIRDQHWPYRRAHDLENDACHELNRFLEAIKKSFISLGCANGKFSSRDWCLARDWQQRGIPINIVPDALVMGACRKYSSWFNGGPMEPIGSLACFEALVSETQERPPPVDHRHYLRKKGRAARRGLGEEVRQTAEKSGMS